ncbi:MAG: hypothetical protein OQK97_03015 [Deltaproteobacteria bacterium]|nr:hypothetical protein [Deltaproteobacteria bacterium]
MQRPVQIKKTIGFILFILLFFLSITMTAKAAESITLNSMQKQESPSSTRIIFNFPALPKFTTEHSGQRVDLLLDDVQLSPSLHQLPEDETVVKILLTEKPQQLMVSLLLRRAPKQVVTESQVDPSRLVMDIYWEADEGARPSVAFRIADMPPKKAGRRAAQFQRESPWEGHWNEFFHDYRSYWKLQLPVNFTLPELPALIIDEQSPLWPLQQHADEKMFLSLLQTATALTDLDEQQRYLRDVLVAEAQLRTGDKEAGSARLERLMVLDGSEQMRVDYLTAYAEALEEQPLVAQIKLQQLLPQLQDNHPLLPLVQLLIAETALASNMDAVALQHLEDPATVWPDNLQPVVDLRRADALAGAGSLDQALSIYQGLEKEPGLFEFYRFSCNRAAFSAFKQQNYQLATIFYRKLVEIVKDEPGEDLILFAVGASAYESGDLGWGMIGLQRASLDLPGTEGGDRAALRLIDLHVIKEGELGLAKAVTEYAQLGERSQFLPVREESRFKQALALYLLKEHRNSVTELMDFRRNFGSSSLRREVDFLLLDQLPKVVRQLLEEKNDLQAVVLVEQNRQLLLRSGFDRNFLHDLASAFDKLGLYERAGRVLLYLFDRTTGHPEQQAIYLPLARSFLKREEYLQASNYASRYLEEYPQGEDSGALFGILLDAFERQERQQELLAWLNKKDRPQSPDLELRAARIYWQLEELPAVVESLEWIRQSGHSLGVKEMALLGEAYYQLGNNRAAEKIYRTLFDDPNAASLARYRTAQILLRRQQLRPALNLLAGVVEKDAKSPWGKLAQDLLIQEQR